MCARVKLRPRKNAFEALYRDYQTELLEPARHPKFKTAPSMPKSDFARVDYKLPILVKADCSPCFLKKDPQELPIVDGNLLSASSDRCGQPFNAKNICKRCRSESHSHVKRSFSADLNIERRPAALGERIIDVIFVLEVGRMATGQLLPALHCFMKRSCVRQLAFQEFRFSYGALSSG
jgi:hypothetical protein